MIRFDESGHVYYAHDGRRVRSVTQVLGDAGISDWSYVPADVLRAAQERGTAVHKACHLLNFRQLDPKSVDERIAGYVEAWKAFRMDHSFAPRHSEHFVYRRITVFGTDAIVESPTDIEICGMLDFEGSVRNHGDVIGDIKTGIETDAWPVQLAAYARGFSPVAQYTHKRIVVQVNKSGRYKIHAYPIRRFSVDWGVFRDALIEGKRKELANS